MTSEIEVAWAAGFFDGEGTVGAFRRERGSDVRALKLSVCQADPRPLLRFARTFGFPETKVYGPEFRTSGRVRQRKPMWRFQIADRDDVLRVLSLMEPYLSDMKREQAVTAVARIEAQGATNPSHKGVWKKTHCVRGHDLATTRGVDRSGKVYCLECNRIRCRERREVLALGAAS